MSKPLTYGGAGVDRSAEEEAIASLVASAFIREGRYRPIDLGTHYAGLIEFGENALALCTDGVGSKLLLAQQHDRIHSVGIDCVAMNVNDIICVGAEPVAFVDYLALHHPDSELTAALGRSLRDGLEQANCSLIGGETATLPDIIHSFDLAGTCLGWVQKDRIIRGDRIAPGDILIGLPSSGPHSNGFTLIRRILEQSKPELGAQLLDQLLAPTVIYVKPILELLKKVDVHGLFHITGGGLNNLFRLQKGVTYYIDTPLPIPEIFTKLEQWGPVERQEMAETFNMGCGFVLAVGFEDSTPTLQLLRHLGARQIGRVLRSSGVDQVEVPDWGVKVSRV